MLLSIIIPVYNVEKYIRKCLNSVFSQNFPNNEVEVIVVNDGTPDNSMQIVKEFSSNPSLRIINQENKGLSGARNTGIEAACGEWIWFVDSDDWIEEGFLPKVLPLLYTQEEDVLRFKIREYEEATNTVVKTRKSICETQIISCSGAEMILAEMNLQCKITPIQTFIIRRSLITKNNLRFVCGIYHEDKEFSPRLLISANQVADIPMVAYCYLLRSSGSITSNKAIIKKRIKNLFDIYESSCQLREQQSEANRKAMDWVCYFLLANIWRLVRSNYTADWKIEYGINPYMAAIRTETVRIMLKNDVTIRRLVGRSVSLLFPNWAMKKGFAI